jgi:hypothetical protein
MMLRKLLLLTILPLGTHLLPAQTTSSPKEVVMQFLALDASGARLRSSPNDPIWQLTADDGEPPVQPIVLIKSCRVSNVAQLPKSAKVQVSCTVTGTVKDDGATVSYLRNRHLANASFTVLNTDGSWKISQQNLKFPPHVEPAAYLSHLDTLIHLYNDEKDKADPRYKSLLRLKEALQATSPAK